MLVGSLFSGIGGFDLGLERAGMRIAWQCESDPFCRTVLAKHWPLTSCYWDVTKLSGYDLPHHTDVICGGFPCQDISIAGKGVGITGPRSGLWGEYARLIGEIRPRYVIVENVAALLARGLERVLGDLAALGYDAEWDCIPASAVGAPHRRDRIWIVAYPDSSRSQGHRRPFACAGEVASAARSAAPRGLANADSEGRAHVQEGAPRLRLAGEGDAASPAAGGGRLPGWSASEQWAVEPDVGRVAHGIPDRVDRLRSLGNALVPQIAEWLGRRILEYERQAA